MVKLKKLCLFLVVSMAISMFSVAVYGEEPINVSVDNKPIQFDVPPAIKDGRTMVPMRAILEALGLELKWDPETKTVTAKNDKIEVVLPLDSNTAVVNGKPVQLDVPASIVDGRTMVPARFISESAGAEVKWDAGTRTVNITSSVYNTNITDNSKNNTNTNNISNVNNSTISINNSNVDNSVTNSNNVTNNYDYSTKINNNINNTANTNVIGNMDEILKQIAQQDALKNAGMINIKYTVENKADNKPVKGAVLFVNGMAVGISDESGAIMFGVYPYAANLIKISKDGYKDYQATKSYTKALEETITVEGGEGGKASGVIKFADPNLEAAIRDALGKAEGDLTAEDLARITGLSATSRGIKSIEGIQNLVNLEELNLERNEIADIGSLSSLKKLSYLILKFNKLENISSLSGLTELQILDLSCNEITDIKPVEKLTNLVGLNIDGTKIKEIKPLAALEKLDKVRMFVDAQLDISPIANCKDLRTVFVDIHKVQNYTVLFDMPSLVQLGLKETVESDIEQLQPLVDKLKTLHLESPKLSSYMILHRFSNLEGLAIVGAGLEDISVLRTFPQLKYLNLSQNEISDIGIIASFSGLDYLMLDDNKIFDISSLSACTTLTSLSLRNNGIKDISALSGLKNLEMLYLLGNQVEDFKPLAGYYEKLEYRDFEMK